MSAQRNNQNETAPLLTETRRTSANEADALEEATVAGMDGETNVMDVVGGVLTVGSLLAIAAFTWTLIFRSNPKSLKYFAFHPPAQTLAVLLFGLGILTLQPTRGAQSKARGLKRHQIIQLALGVPVLLFGSIAMVVNKWDHGAPHFTSWHGKFGLVALIWLVVHIVGGGLSVWNNGSAFGGKDKGKAFWKWHRLSGYLLFPWLLFTIHLAGGYADWVVGHTTSAQRTWIYTILPIVTIAGLFVRVRKDKLPGLQ